jgi:sec-independent protein translocase protein TatB
MFDIGWSELLLIGVVALVVFGPKELPGVLRTMGQWMTKVRRMATEFQNQFQDAIREAELAELKKEVDEMAASAANYTNFDPIEDVRKDLEKAAGDLPSFDAPTSSPAAAANTAPAPAIDELPAIAQVAPPSAEPAPIAAEEATTGPDEIKPDAGRAA